MPALPGNVPAQDTPDACHIEDLSALINPSGDGRRTHKLVTIRECMPTSQTRKYPPLWASVRLFERRVQVVPEVVDMFAADAQAQEPGGHMTLSGELAAPLDGGFDAAQTGGADDDLHGVAEAVSCGGVGHLEGEHCPEAGHLRGGCAVSGVAGETGVAHAADGRVFIEAAGEFAGVTLAAVEAQGKGAQAAQRQEGLQGSGGRARQAAAVTDSPGEGLLACDGDAG